MKQNKIPDYHGNSIVNLVSSILLRFDKFSQYPPLEILPKEIIADSTNLIFFVIDGMGSAFLEKYGKKTIFHQYLRGKITSSFPTTTAAAMLSYYTGFAPKNHGIPAWFTYIRQIGMITAILPFNPRIKHQSLTEYNIEPREVYNFTSYFDDLEISQHIFMPEELNRAPLMQIINHNRTPHGFKDLDDLFQKLDTFIQNQQGQSNYIFVYWPELDSLAHKYGINHKKTITHLHDLNQTFEKYTLDWKAKDPFCRIIISADHGLIDIATENQLFLEQYPILHQSLTLPLAGEGRVPFFYVRPDQLDVFKQQIEENFGNLGELYSRQEILQSELFGLFDLHPQLPSRIGDFVFIFDQPYILKDQMLGEERSEMIGYHGGLSEEELYVPFIVI